jgi:hypothetical protein
MPGNDMAATSLFAPCCEECAKSEPSFNFKVPEFPKAYFGQTGSGELGIIGTILKSGEAKLGGELERASSSILSLDTIGYNFAAYGNALSTSGLVQPQLFQESKQIEKEVDQMRSELVTLRKEKDLSEKRVQDLNDKIGRMVQERRTDYERQVVLPESVIRTLNSCNLIFESIAGGKIFNVTADFAIELVKPCEDESALMYKLGAFYELDQVPLDPLRGLVSNPPPDAKSLVLIELALRQNGVQRSEEATRTLRSLVRIRSSQAPFHSSKAELVKLYRGFEEPFPPNYARLWPKVLSCVSSELSILLECLNELSKKHLAAKSS